MQKFIPNNHINNLIDDPYYEKLIILRDLLSRTLDLYFQSLNAPKIDLYMVTGSVSSPMGTGSDSEPWPIKMGFLDTYLVDSAQFGMEPLVQNKFDAVYCYLPSFRGEIPGKHHLNQFYHCEAEIKGSLDDCILIVDRMFKKIFGLLKSSEAGDIIDPIRLQKLLAVGNNSIEKIEFSKAIEVLGDDKQYIQYTPQGRKITRLGEIELSKRLFQHGSAFWIIGFDRDIVPFYQKPNPKDPERVLNGDLILPPVGIYGFAGEVLGSGQRQNDVKEMMESIQRQEVHNQESYQWYINLRKRPDYKQTSGFGLGIERLLSWMIGTEDIASAAIYPVMNNIKTEY